MSYGVGMGNKHANRTEGLLQGRLEPGGGDGWMDIGLYGSGSYYFHSHNSVALISHSWLKLVQSLFLTGKITILFVSY